MITSFLSSKQRSEDQNSCDCRFLFLFPSPSSQCTPESVMELRDKRLLNQTEHIRYQCPIPLEPQVHHLWRDEDAGARKAQAPCFSGKIPDICHLFNIANFEVLPARYVKRQISNVTLEDNAGNEKCDSPLSENRLGQECTVFRNHPVCPGATETHLKPWNKNLTVYGKYAEHFEGSCSSSTCTTPTSPVHPPETSTPCSCHSQCQCSEEEDGEQHSWIGDNLDDIAKLKHKGLNDTSPSSLDRPFICKKCMTTFKRKYDLVQHTSAVHDKKRPYTCSKCASRFAHKGTLTKHYRTVHLGVRPFSCSQCSTKFSERGNLNKHMERIHKIKMAAKVIKRNSYKK